MKKNNKKQTNEKQKEKYNISQKKSNPQETKNNNSVVTNPENEQLKKLIILIVIISVVFLSFYGLTILLTNKEPEEDLTEVEINRQIILTGNILDQVEDYYYVFATNSDSLNLDIYRYMMESYAEYQLYMADESEEITYYYTNLNNPLNKTFNDEESNLKVTDISKLKIADDTLFYIEKGKITKVYEGFEEIKEILYELNELDMIEEESE